MTRLSERRARARGRRLAAELAIVAQVRAELPTASLEDIVALGLRIEGRLSPLREGIGAMVAAHITLSPSGRAQLNVAAAEALPVIEELCEAQCLLMERAQVLAVARGISVP